MLFFRQAGSVALLFGAIGLSGCAMQEAAGPVKDVAGSAMQGVMTGGQQPVAGAAVQVIAVGKTGYGSAGTVLATTTTDANGNFSFPANSYTCGSSTDQIVLTARGGNPGLPGSVNNTAIFLMSIAGPCGALTPSTRIDLNEVTTVVSSYVLRPFITGNNVGATLGNLFGLDNAVKIYPRLVNNAGGRAPGDASVGMNFPADRINALANSIASCINTSAASSSPCQSLFTLSGTPTSGGQANVLVALHNILTNPTTNIGPIFLLATAVPPFQPTLTEAPPDWSLPIFYTMGNLNSSTPSFDIDYRGNVWVATTAGFGGTLEEVGPDGSLLRTGLLNGTLDSPSFVTATGDGRILVGSQASGDASVVILDQFSAAEVGTFPNATVMPVNAMEYTGYSSKLAALDSAPNNGIVRYSDATTGTAFGTQLDYMAVPPGGGKIYLTAKNSSYTQLFLPGASNSQFLSYTGSQWVFSLTYAYSIAPYSSNTSVIAGNRLTSGSEQVQDFSYRTPLIGGDGEIDGDGALWVPTADADNNSAVTRRFSTPDVPPPSIPAAGTPIGHIQDYFTTFNRVRIDYSGNVWATSVGGGLFEIVGAGAPTWTPMHSSVVNGQVGSRP